MEILQSLGFSTHKSVDNHIIITIDVPSDIIATFFDFAAQSHQNSIDIPGFKQGSVPLPYIKEHFKPNLLRHIQEISLKYFVTNALLEKLKSKKIVTIGQPKLITVAIDNDQSARYTFQALIPQEVYIKRWKNLPFKSVQRKKYRDIDNQVISFLEEEAQQEGLYKKGPQTIAIGDWICFDAWLVNTNQNPIFKKEKTRLWLRIGQEEPDSILQELFVGKKIGETLFTKNASIQDYFCDLYDAPYTYGITIIDIVPAQYVCLNLFKKYFKLKSKKEVHDKLIEIFSFNSDVSQRRLIAHNALALIRNKNKLHVPNQGIEEQKALILQELQKKADYMVYKMENSFDEQVHVMARNQVLEKVTVDTLAHQENISVSHDDIKGFLNLLKRSRTKDFIYFHHPLGKIKGQEVPIPHAVLQQCCLREKTLNYIIRHLTQP